MTPQQTQNTLVRSNDNYVAKLLLNVIEYGYLISITDEGNVKLHKALNKKLSNNIISELKANKEAILEYWSALPKNLSTQEESLLFINAYQNNQSPEYNISKAIYFKNNANIDCIKKGIKELVLQHPLLTCEFNSQSQQSVHKLSEVTDALFPEPVIIRHQHELEVQLSTNANKLFDLSSGPLFRFNIYQLKYGQFELCIQFTIHHIIFDGWSFNSFVKKLTAYYHKLGISQDISKSGQGISYFDYCKWQGLWYQTAWFKKTISYWEKHLADYKNPDILNYLSRQTAVPINCDTMFLYIDYSPIKSFCSKNKCTAFHLLISALAILISSIYNVKDLIIGAPFSNRSLPETESTIGYFANTLPIRFMISHSLSIRSLLRETTETCNNAAIHQAVPFAKIINHVGENQPAFQSPLFSFLFALHNHDANIKISSEILSKIENIHTRHARFDFTIDCTQSDDELVFQMMYNNIKFSETFAEIFGESFNKILNIFLTKSSEATIGDLHNDIKEEVEQLQNKIKPTKSSACCDMQPSQEISGIEQKVRQIWQTILTEKHLPAQESFFSLGGTSILTLPLINKINAEFLTALPVSWIFAHPTIKQQSAALIKTSLRDYNAILKFREPNFYKPLVLIPPSLVGAEFYHSFSNLFSPNIACYSVENYNLNCSLPPIYSCSELALTYNNFICEEVSSFFLGGYCYGAIIALEMASLLAKKNLQPLALYLIDPLLMLEKESVTTITNEELLELAGYDKLTDELISHISAPQIDKLRDSAMLDREILYNYSKIIPTYSYRAIIFLTKERDVKTMTYEDEKIFWQTHLPAAEILTIDAKHYELLNAEYLEKIVQKIEKDIIECTTTKCND